MVPVREYTNKLLEAVQEGIVDRDWLIESFLLWMSEADVKKMCEAYEIDIETFDFDPTGIVNE